MSASPADHTPGRTPGRTPNGGAPQMIRRPKNADPLVRPKDKQKRRVQRPPGANGVSTPQSNGMQPPMYGQAQPNMLRPGRPAPPVPSISRSLLPSIENASSGWSSAPLGHVTDYPLILTKRALMDGFRHHVARFSSKKKVDPRNTDDFVRPVRLHRRDPRAPPAGAGVKNEDQANGDMDGVDDKEKEKEAILKAERDAIREAENALVAPATHTSGHKKLGVNMKKTEQIYRNDQTDEQKAKSKLKYEEALPWHLEDFENKSTWVGTYEAALSDTYTMMVKGADNKFRVAPLEKWYKFTQKNQFKTLSIEEAEMRFNKKIKEPRWFMDSEESKKKREVEQENKKASSGLFLGKWEKGGGGSGVAKPVAKRETADADDLDFQEDRFADDEENMLFEEDDETKEAEARIKRDQLQANVFDLKEEKEYEKQEQLEKKERDEEKKLGKRVKKALMKREKNYIYDSDSTDNPYSSDSESSTSETERLKAEEEKKKATEAPKSSPEKPKKTKEPKQTSGSGTSTPSHRASKHPDTLSRTTSSSNLKRPGSPLNSEGSGNESSRKKAKKKHALTSAQSQPSNLGPPSRATSPPLSSSQPTKSTKRRAGSSSATDSEGVGAISSGETSDGARKRIKLRLSMGSKSGSPTGSRAGSPETGTRSATSPTATTTPPTTTTQQPKEDPPFPTAAELKARVPKTGITIGALLAHFRGQVVGEERKNRFTKLMRENSKYDKERKVLIPMDREKVERERAERERVEREKGRVGNGNGGGGGGGNGGGGKK